MASSMGEPVSLRCLGSWGLIRTLSCISSTRRGLSLPARDCPVDRRLYHRPEALPLGIPRLVFRRHQGGFARAHVRLPSPVEHFG
jgi:hypothetical protein